MQHVVGCILTGILTGFYVLVLLVQVQVQALGPCS
jgi:hypothetical protein